MVRPVHPGNCAEATGCTERNLSGKPLTALLFLFFMEV